MSAAGWALQKAIYETLRADAALKALIGDPARVYDEPPTSSSFGGAFPFVVFGDSRLARIPGTDGLVEHDIRLAIHSRYEGRREVKDVAERLAALLDGAALVLDGFHLVSLSLSSSDIFHRRDAGAHQGLLRFRAVTERM